MPATFTYAAYRELLRELARAGYVFGTFPEAGALLERGRPLVLLRHDVDFDPGAALRLAEIEAEEERMSTYFFLLRTPHYNLFSAEATGAVRKILALSHRLGLHFDCAPYGGQVSPAEWAAACRREREVLEAWFQSPVEIVSYHRPGPIVLSGNAEISAPLPHTYLPLFTRQIHYCSDSRGQWRFGFPLETDAFRQRRALHLLLHPIWWTEAGCAANERLQRYVEERAQQLDRSVATNCAAYARA